MPFVLVPLAARTFTVRGSRGTAVVEVDSAVDVVVVVFLGAVVPVVPITTVDLSAEWRRPTPIRKATTRRTAARPVWMAAERLKEPSSAACAPRLIGPAALPPACPRTEPGASGP